MKARVTGTKVLAAAALAVMLASGALIHTAVTADGSVGGNAAAEIICESNAGTEKKTKQADVSMKAAANEVQSEDDVDYGDLTAAEAEELESLYQQVSDIFDNKIYGGADALTMEEYEKRFAQYEGELDRIYDRIMELESKAGWYEMGTEEVYGDLTDEEIEELNELFDRQIEIDEEIYNGDFYISPDEYDRRAEPYREELDKLEARCTELETKAGWLNDSECSDEFDLGCDFSRLTEEERAEYDRISERISEIFDEICGTDDVLSQEEYDKRYAQYEEELDKLTDRSFELEKKAGWYDELAVEESIDNGDFTDEEYDEYVSLLNELSLIDEKIYGDDFYVSDAEYERRSAGYEDELNRIYSKIDELMQKAELND